MLVALGLACVCVAASAAGVHVATAQAGLVFPGGDLTHDALLGRLRGDAITQVRPVGTTSVVLRVRSGETTLGAYRPAASTHPRGHLHEIAAGSMDLGTYEINHLAQSYWHGYRYRYGEVVGIDREKQLVITAPYIDEHGEEVIAPRVFRYDTLVISIGSLTNDFGTQGAAEYSIKLDTPQAARRFNERLLNACLRAHSLPGDDPGAQWSVVIVGGGATGVELAAELHHAAHEFTRYGLTSIDPNKVNITVIEAADRVLPVLPPEVSARAEQQLREFGIQVLTNHRVVAIHPDAVECSGNLMIPANMKVWSAGIKAPDFLKEIAGLETNRINQLVVGATLQTSRDPNIFAFGDCACYIPTGEQRPVPPRAQVANQQAILLAKSMKARIEGRPLPEFEFNDKGSLISLSNRNTVGNLMGKINVQGLFARLMYVSLYRFHQVALHGVFKTGVLMAKDVLARNSGPTLKLH